jgi:stearoyl-CoA desaturase (delta-9 desaturase)
MRPFNIIASEVRVERWREYWAREWNSRDLTYAGFIGAMHILCLWAPATFSWGNLALGAGMYLVTGMLGITLSYHRQLSHRSFTTPKWLEYALAYCGVLSMQGPPIEWVSAHRYHHQFCDTPKDPHTPREGFWHSHGGWILDNDVNDERCGMRNNCADMEKQPFYQFLERTYIWHPLLAGALTYAIGGFGALVWGVAVRTVWVWHITWAVNSVSHVWGKQTFDCGDESRNNLLVGILAFGEGWHNNHHAFEFSARHGLEWQQVDMTWWTICLLKFLGLAKNIKLPTEKQMDRLRFPTAASA